ncbi:MAG: hypothetical protein J5998_10240, partial [Clostridia bacterium]|nr:hypothetical protein [Clostridia bacterium]
QCIRSFGLIDCSIPRPRRLPCDRVALADGWLYAASGARLFRRRWLGGAPADPDKCAEPRYKGYYD